MMLSLEIAAKLLGALAPDAENLDFLALGKQRIGALARQPHDGRIERPAQAAFAGAHQQQMRLVVAGAGEQPRRGANWPTPMTAMLPSTRSMRSANGRAASAAACARRSFEAATICIALVIFCVALVAAMRTRMSLREAMCL